MLAKYGQKMERKDHITRPYKELSDEPHIKIPVQSNPSWGRRSEKNYSDHMGEEEDVDRQRTNQYC